MSAFHGASLLLAAAPMVDLAHGAPAELTGKALGLARALFVPLTILSLILEGVIRHGPGQREIGPALFRAVVILYLLTFYSTLVGGVVKLSDELAAELTPKDAEASFSKALEDWRKSLADEKASVANARARAEAEGDEDGASSLSTRARVLMAESLGGVVFDSAVALLLLLGQGAHFVMGYMSRILAALLYALGPLALVFAIPRASDSGGRWFRMLVSVLCWPLLSGLILTLTASFVTAGLKTDADGSAFNSIVAAMLLLCTAAVCPFIASSLVGGSMKNFAADGLDAALFRANMAVRGFKSVVPTERVMKQAIPTPNRDRGNDGAGGSGGAGRNGSGGGGGAHGRSAPKARS